MTIDTKLSWHRLFVAGLIAGLSACGGGGGGSTATPSDPAVVAPGTPSASSLQGILDDAIRRGIDGISLTILDTSGELRQLVSGTQDRASNTPMSTNSVFKMASVSKLYVATAVVQLNQQGLLSLDDTIAAHLPELAPRIANSNAITVRMLLRHRSGVPDFDSQIGFSWRGTYPDRDEVLEFALDLPADFAPDSREEYSNTNYLLLGEIMDAVLGYSHHQQVSDFILSPLGLSDTYSLATDFTESSRLVRGYWDGQETTDWAYVIPGGSMLASGADIAVFLDGLANGKLLDEDGLAIYRSVYFLNHSGWLPGYQTYARWEPTLSATVVLHVNNTGGQSEETIDATYREVSSFLTRN